MCNHTAGKPGLIEEARGSDREKAAHSIESSLAKGNTDQRHSEHLTDTNCNKCLASTDASTRPANESQHQESTENFSPLVRWIMEDTTGPWHALQLPIDCRWLEIRKPTEDDTWSLVVECGSVS